MNFKKVVFLFIILILLSMPAFAEQGTLDSIGDIQEEEIAFIVNGQEVNADELESHANLYGLLQNLSQVDHDFTALLLTTEAGTDLINEFLKSKIYNEEQKIGLAVEYALADEAKKNGIEWTQQERDQFFEEQMTTVKAQENVTDEELLQFVKYQGFEDMDHYKKEMLDNIQNQVIIQKLQDFIINNVEISSEEIESYYNENKEQFEHGEQVEASHILVEEEETAEEILNKLNNGQDFVELAHEYSIDNASLQSDGNLGYFEKERMVAPFSEAAFAMEADEISDIVETTYGYHIIKVHDKRDAGVSSLSESEEAIKNALMGYKADNSWKDIYEAAIENMELEIKMD